MNHQPEFKAMAQFRRQIVEEGSSNSLFYRCCDALACLIADCVERPGTSLALVVIGQLTVIVPAIVFAWVRL